MNKSLIVIIALFAVVASFAVGAYFYKQSQNKKAVETAQTIATEAAANVEDNPLVRPHSPIMGRADAPVTIVEFFDPSCESCRAAFPFVHDILQKYPNDVRLVLRYAAFHQSSDVAVGILEAARKQNLFDAVIGVLLQRQPEWAIHPVPDMNKAWEFAKAAGLDIEKAKIDAASPAVAEILKQDAADIQINKVRGTPTFFVNGKPVLEHGPQGLSGMVDLEVERAKAKAIEP